MKRVRLRVCLDAYHYDLTSRSGSTGVIAEEGLVERDIAPDIVKELAIIQCAANDMISLHHFGRFA